MVVGAGMLAVPSFGSAPHTSGFDPAGLTSPFGYFGNLLVAPLALPLSYPVTPQPLASLPRYEVVLFPLFMWAASWLAERRLTQPALAASAVLLGLFTAEFATWRVVA